MKKIIYAICIGFVLTLSAGCNNNNAKAAIDLFYKSLAKKDYSVTYNLMDKRLKRFRSENAMRYTFNIWNDIRGPYKSKKLVKFFVKQIKGDKDSGHYYIYKVHYSNITYIETFQMVMESDGYKIAKYLYVPEEQSIYND